MLQTLITGKNISNCPICLVIVKKITNQCGQREVVKQICKDLPNIGITIPADERKNITYMGLYLKGKRIEKYKDK